MAQLALPIELLPLITSHADRATLATCLRVCRLTYSTALPLLYRTLHLANDNELLSLLNDLDPAKAASAEGATRRREALTTVKEIQLDETPSPRSAAKIITVADVMPLRHVFPSAHTYSLSAGLVESLPSRAVSTSYNRSKACLKIYESLRRLARPKHLCMVIPDFGYMEPYVMVAGGSGNQDRNLFFRKLKDHWPELEDMDWGYDWYRMAFPIGGVDNIYRVPTSMEARGSDLFFWITEWEIFNSSEQSPAPLRITLRCGPNIDYTEAMRDYIDDRWEGCVTSSMMSEGSARHTKLNIRIEQV